MRIGTYFAVFSALFLGISALAQQGSLLVKFVPDPEAPPKPEEAPAPPPPAPVPQPGDVRAVIKVNVKNETGGLPLVFYTKLKADGPIAVRTTDQEAWEYLKVYTYVKNSGTVATIVGDPGMKYAFDRSRVWVHKKKDDGGESVDDYEKIECRVNDNDLGKSAEKSITFRVRKLPGDDVLSCVIYYDAE